MGNCFGSEETDVEAVKAIAHHAHARAMARPGMVAPQPNAHAAAAMSSPGQPRKSPTAPTTSSSGSGTTRPVAGGSTNGGSDASPSREGRILEAPNLRIFTFAELKAATRNFKSDTLLGEGGFGRVHKGWVDEKTMSPARSGAGMPVAVKKLNPESLQGVQEWQSEVNFLGRLIHPNLVRLLGYCWEDKELLLVYEFMAKGNLEDHLFRNEPRKGAGAFQPLSWSLRLRVAIDAARGLAFLHSSEKHVIYRDFKASNILLDTQFHAKLSDFGLAKDGPAGGSSHVTTRVMGTYGYAAPEYVATGHLYVKSDVYGFGVVLLEVLTGLRALDTDRPSGQHNLVDSAKPHLADRRKLARLMDPRLEGQYSSRGAQRAAQLTLRCLAAEHTNRPSMKEVVAVLQEIESMSRGGSRSDGSVGSASPRPNNARSSHRYGQSPRPGYMSERASPAGSHGSQHPSPRVR